MATFKPSPAEQAASWLINMDDVVERNRLYSGHRARRQPSTDAQGYHITDHSEADAWLVDQWQHATGGEV